MIDLNTTVKGEPAKDFSPIPDGWYDLVVDSISDWKAKDIKYTNKETKTTTDATIYSSMVKFMVCGGEHDGARVFHSLTTHPNMPWVIPAIIDGLGLGECSPADLIKKAVGLKCNAHVCVDSYDKVVTNKETGIEEKTPVLTNKVKSFKSKDVVELADGHNALDISSDDLPF